MIITKTPYRLSLFGGGTDYPAWFEFNPSRIISAAMQQYCFITVKNIPPFFDHKTIVSYSEIEKVKSIDEIKHPSARECLRYMGVEDVSVVYEGDLPARSGIGSSSASAAGAVVAANHLIGGKFSALQLIEFAMQGEKLASGTAHADNVAPAVMGGFTLVRSNCPLDVVKLPVPPNLYAVVIHPLIEVKTSDARKILKTHVSLKDAVTQWSNVGGLVAGLFMSDYGLIARSLQDVIVEPIRSILIPAFDELKQRCLSAGALGGGISGSGPSVFMLCDGLEKAQLVEKAMQAVYSQLAVSYETHVSPIGQQGVLVC